MVAKPCWVAYMEGPSMCVCVGPLQSQGSTRIVLIVFSFCRAGGHGTRLQTVSNKAMQSGGISSLASWTYLQQFLGLRKGLMHSADKSDRRHFDLFVASWLWNFGL